MGRASAASYLFLIAIIIATTILFRRLARNSESA
jgi:ABC-type sugar transport system permease subunit